MSSTTAHSYPESVGSCCPSTPPTPPPLAAAPRSVPVKRQLDFDDAGAGAGAGGDLEVDEDMLISAADDIERGYSEAKRRAPPCVRRRGECAVRRDEQGQWKYVCPSQPGKGACSHKELVNPAEAKDSEWPFDVVNNEIVPTAQATPRAEVCQGSPSMLRQPIATETPVKSSMPPYNTRSPMTPHSDNTCFGCGEKGHCVRDCPKPSLRRSNCPQLLGS
ncbi:unnamed protein product [Urochloa humidicola]